MMVGIKILISKKIFNFLLSILKIKADISIKIGIKTNIIYLSVSTWTLKNFKIFILKAKKI